MPVNIDKVIEDLYSAAETPEEKEQVRSLLSKPKLKSRLAAPLEEAESRITETVNSTKKWRDEQQGKIDEFWSKYGDPDKLQSTSNPNLLRGESGQFISKADFEKYVKDTNANFENRLMQHSQTAVAISKDLVSVSYSWSKEFDEPLPIEEVEQTATKHGVSVAIAADMLARPKREARQKEAFDKQLSEAREQGRQEGFTQARSEANVDSRYIDGHAIFGKRDVSDINPTTGKKMTDEEYEEASMAAFEKSFTKINNPTPS